MKNKVTILTNLSEEITPISISDLQNIVPKLPSGITVPNDSYGGFIPIHYNIDHDINFSAVKFYLNDELIHISNKPTDTFNINVTTEFNKLSGYSVNRFDLKLPQTEFEVIFKTTLDQTKSPLQISKILKYNLPNFILDDYPVFVDFIEAYYQFLEKSNNPNLIHYNLENYKDIDSVPEYIVDYFRKELIPNFDLNLTKDRQTGESLNERLLIKHIKEFYDSKGTENSIKFLFRILFDKEATIFYPKVNLLKPSDGVWTIDKTIDVYGTDIVRLYSLVGTRIYQRKTTGEIESHAIIKNVNVKKIPGGFQGSLFLYELSGTFSNTTPILLKEVLDGVSVETPLTVIKISNKNLTISSGRRDSLGGDLSETKRLIPDNDYWQNASYDVQGDADPKSFISIIKKLAHPAGFKIFASYSPTLKLSKTINIKNEVLTSNLTFGSPKTFLNDLIAKTDSLDILLVGDSNIHSGSRDGGYMYGWSYTLDELGVPCYSTPLFPSLTRSLATFAGASGIFKYFPGVEHTRVYSAGAGTTIPAEATGGAHVNPHYGQSIVPQSIANSWNSDIVAISGGWGWSMALTKEGKVYAWGNNDQGQCRGTSSGTPGTIIKPNPYEDGTNAITINGVVLTGVTTISAGGHQGAALKNGGVIMWGNNSNYTTPSYIVAVPSNALSGVDQMSGGDMHTMIIKAGKVYCWGRNNAGECLGTTTAGLQMNANRKDANDNSLYPNTVTTASTPVQIMGVELTNIVKIFGSRFFSVALDTNGKVWSWGNYGQDLVPSILSSGATDINASTFNGLAIKDGKVVGWGNNLHGQCLGSNSSGNLLTSTPNGDYVKIRGNILTDVIAITGGGDGDGGTYPFYSFSAALKKDGSIVTWGSNQYGQCLGTDSSGNPILTPALADGSTAFKVNGSSLSNISSISCGGAHLMALYSGNATYDSATLGYWWKPNSSFNNVTGTLVKKDTWVGSTVSDTYATWINNIWKCGTLSGTKTTSGWNSFNSLVDWAYIKTGVTTSYDSNRCINIAKTGFSDADVNGQGQTLGANKIYGSNPAWYGNFPVEKELNYRNVNVKFPGTNGGSIYLTSRNATNVSGSATPSYYGRYSTDSGSTTEYKIKADVLPIGANSARKYVDAAWQGAHSGNFGVGPIATLLESISVKNQKGYAVNSFHARSGHTAQDIASGLEAAGIESIKIYLKEIRDRQISSGGSGRVLIFVNMGINSNGGAENTLFGDRAERIIVSISTAWSTLGYPKSDLGFLISNSHNGGDPNYTNPTAVIATAEYLKNKYSNVMLVNFDNDTLGSVTRLTNISGYIDSNSSVDAKSIGNTNPQVHLSQGRNVLTGTTTKTLNGEGGYAAIISGLINTVKTSSFTSPVTSINTDNNTVNNTQENTGLTIGNYLAYAPDTVQDLNFLKTDNIDDDTDITSTYRAFPDGLPFGADGKTPTVGAKNYISLIANAAATNAAQLQPVLLVDEEVYFKPNFGFLPGVPESTTTVNGKLTSVIRNIGQLLEGEEVSEKWQCGVHPRSLLNPTEQIFSPDVTFGDLKISDFVGEEDPRSDSEKQKSTTTCGSCVQYNKEHADLLDMIKKNEKIIQDLHDQADTDINASCAWCWIGFTYDLLTSVVTWIAFNWIGAAFVALGVFKTTVKILSKTTSYVYTEFSQVWNGQCWRTVRNTVTKTYGPEFNPVKLAEFFTVKKISRTGLQNAVNTGEASSLWENLCTLGRIWDVRAVRKLIKKKNVIRTFEKSEKQWWPSDYTVLPKPIQDMQITKTVIKPHAVQKIVCDPTSPSGRKVVYEWISEWQVIETPSTEFALWKAENWLKWRDNIRYANVSTAYDSTINKMHWIDVPTALNASQMQLRETVIEFVGFSKRWFANILVAGFGTGSSIILWWFVPSFKDCMDRALADWTHSTDAIFMLEKRAITNQYDEAARICAAYPECCKGGGFIGSGSGSGSSGGGGGGGSGGSNQNNPMILENGIGLDLLDIIEELPVTLNDNTTERLVESSIIKDNIQLNSKYMIDALSPNNKSIEYLNRDERYLFTGSESYQDCIAASLENYNNGSLSANIPDKMKVLLDKTDSDLFIDLSVDLYNFITSIDKNEYALLLSKTPNMLDFIIKWLGLIDNNYAYTNSLDKIIKIYTNNIKFRQLCYPDRSSQGKIFTIKHSLTGLDIQSIQEVLRNTSVDKIKNYLSGTSGWSKMEDLAYWSKDTITPQSVDLKFPIGPPSYGTNGFDGLRLGSFLWPTLSKEFNSIENNRLYSPTMVNSADLTKNVSMWLRNCYSYLNLSTVQLLDLCYVRLTPGFHVSDWNTVMQNENSKRPSFKCINNTQLQEQHPISGLHNMSISKNSFAPSFFADKRDYIFMGDQGCCESHRFVRWLEPTAASNFYFKHIKQIFRVYTDVRIKYIRDLMIYNFKNIKPDLIVENCRNANRCENDGDSNSLCYKEYTYAFGDGGGDAYSMYKSTLIPENKLNEFFEGLCSKINNSYTKLSDEMDKISKIATDLGIALGIDDQKCRTKFKDTVYDKCVVSKPSSGAPKGLNLL